MDALMDEAGRRWRAEIIVIDRSSIARSDSGRMVSIGQWGAAAVSRAGDSLFLC
jgi:hypothetical protein